MTDRPTPDADAVVAAWIMQQYRYNHGPLTFESTHKGACPEATAQDVQGSDGTYGCDTGCDYARLEADITCPHEPPESYKYGTFGELAWILDDILKGSA